MSSTLIRVEIPRDAAHWLREAMIAMGAEAFSKGLSHEARMTTAVAQAIRSATFDEVPERPGICLDGIDEPRRSALASGQAVRIDSPRPEVEGVEQRPRTRGDSSLSRDAHPTQLLASGPEVCARA